MDSNQVLEIILSKIQGMEERIYGMENKIENLGNEFIELKSGQDKVITNLKSWRQK